MPETDEEDLFQQGCFTIISGNLKTNKTWIIVALCVTVVVLVSWTQTYPFWIFTKPSNRFNYRCWECWRLLFWVANGMHTDTAINHTSIYLHALHCLPTYRVGHIHELFFAHSLSPNFHISFWKLKKKHKSLPKFCSTSDKNLKFFVNRKTSSRTPKHAFSSRLSHRFFWEKMIIWQLVLKKNIWIGAKTKRITVRLSKMIPQRGHLNVALARSLAGSLRSLGSFARSTRHLSTTRAR
jgi:hypothetical protein